MKHSSSKLALPPNLQPQSKGNKMRRIFAGLAMASFMMLGMSTAAHAQMMGAYTCTEGGNPPPPGTYPGSLTLNELGSCTIGAVSASGSISIGAGGTIMVGALSGNGVGVQSTGGSVSVSSIDSGAGPTSVFAKDATNSNYFDVTIGGNISAGTLTNIVGKNITSTVPLTSAAIASHGGGTVNLVALKGGVSVTNDSGDINVVGAAGDATTTSVYMSAGDAIGNGNIKVTGTVSTTSAQFTSVELVAGGNISTGAITSPQIQVYANDYGITDTSTFLLGGGGTNGISGAVTANNTTGGGGYIDIENGYQTGIGNITVTAGSVVETGTDGNFIDISALGGTLVLPGGAEAAGKITAGGPDSQILLEGKAVNFVDGTNISSDYLTGGSTHSVVIEADTINYAGTSVVTANGAGQDSDNPAAVFIQGYTSGTTKVQFVGNAVGDKISLGADGDHTYTEVYADAISFATGAVTLHSQGTTDHGVYLNSVDDTNVNDSLTVASGMLTLDATGARHGATDGAGGTVGVDVYSAVLNGSFVLLNANGPDVGDGVGGTISFDVASTTVGPATQVSLTANAASSGSGNASDQAITLNTGSSITLGSKSTGEFALSANGGGTGGDAGTISVNAGADNTVTFDTPNVAPLYSFVTAKGSDTGKGGTVNIVGKAVSISGVATPINVNGDIVVDGGANVGTAISDGSITINQVTCQQWKTGLPVYPTSYWNCIDGNQATGMPIANAAHTLEGPLQSLLATTKSAPVNTSVQIYDMSIDDKYRSFFGLAPYNPFVKGDYGVSNLPIRVSVVYVNVYNAAGASVTAVDYSGSNTIMPASIVHELGHELDYIWGNLSTQDPFNTLQAPDYSNVDSWMNQIPASGGNPAQPRPCGTVFVAASNYCAVGGSNGSIFVFEYTPTLYELFAYTFEHIESTRTNLYNADPWLEAPLGFLPSEIGYIQGLIAHPPGAVN